MICAPTSASTTPGAVLRKSAQPRLLIFDNPMTTFLEALGADLPAAHVGPEIWRFRDEAKPYLDRLREAEFSSTIPRRAARQAGAIYADPRAWWDRAGAARAHRAFAESVRARADRLARAVAEGTGAK